MPRPQNDVQDEQLRTTVLSQAKTIEELTKMLASQEKRAQRRLKKLKAANARIAALEAELIGYQNLVSPDRPETRLEGQRQVTLSPLSTNPSSPTGALPAIAVSDSELPSASGNGTARPTTDPQHLSARAGASTPSLRNHFRFLRREEERYAATPAPSPASLPTTATLDTPRAGPRVSRSERPDTASLASRTGDAAAAFGPKV